MIGLALFSPLPGQMQPNGSSDPYGTSLDGGRDGSASDDNNQLRLLCNAVTAPSVDDEGQHDNDREWDSIRQWLLTNGAKEARQAVESLGEYQTTALHLACRNVPPVDVIDAMLSISPETVQWEDSFGWLPLHYACANRAPDVVLKMLAEAYPESMTSTDKRGRTPLHFALGNSDHPCTPAAVLLLSSSGAGSCADENGMLPLHYACAYGASEEALYVLVDRNEDSITALDKKQRSPLHFAMSNADRDAEPGRAASFEVIRFLIAQNRNVVNVGVGEESSQQPLRTMASKVHNLNEASDRDKCDNAEKSLILYLEAEPEPTAGFLTALQVLPQWLLDRAVVHPSVQALLNSKISLRFPTALIMLDFYFLCVVIITYSIRVNQALECRFSCCGEFYINPQIDRDSEECIVPTGSYCQGSDLDQNWAKCKNSFSVWALSPLYIGAIYFAIREIVQMLSYISLGHFRTWLADRSNLLDVAFIAIICFWTVVMQTGAIGNNEFRTGTAVSLLFLWINVLSFLKSIFIDFAVFVRGVLHVVNRLAVFVSALVVILIAFAQMFVTLYRQTPHCDDTCASMLDEDYDDTCQKPFCGGLWESFLKVYTMMLGEVDETLFETSRFSLVLFVIFMFLVVILLANVLIAIVTDSYGVIKNERAAIVFWSNRLDFVAEMDAIVNGPWKRKGASQIDRDSSRELWKKLMDLFEEDIEEFSALSSDFWCYFFLRIVVALFVIPLWLLLGIASAGWLWPPQVRAAFLVQRVSKRNAGNIKEAEQRTKYIIELRNDVKVLQEEVTSEIMDDRQEIVAMKLQLGDMKNDVMHQMKEIKQVMTRLFDLSASAS